jgi:hypothetical protein
MHPFTNEYRYIVVVKRDGEEAELTPFIDKDEARKLYLSYVQNWSEVYFCKILLPDGSSVFGPGEVIPEIREVRYLTDDRDGKRRNELVIEIGGNGDWYVSVVPEGEGTAGRGVRLSTSGGAATRAPGLTSGIAIAYKALVRAIGEGIIHTKE